MGGRGGREGQGTHAHTTSYNMGSRGFDRVADGDDLVTDLHSATTVCRTCSHARGQISAQGILALAGGELGEKSGITAGDKFLHYERAASA